MALFNQIDPPEPQLEGEIDAAYEQVNAVRSDLEDICARLDDFGFLSQDTLDYFNDLDEDIASLLLYLRAEIPEPDPDADFEPDYLNGDVK